MKKLAYLFSLLLLATSCTPATPAGIKLPYLLTTFTENDVQVSIQLTSDTTGGLFLSATFTPPDGYHVYSKDIPLTGVDGLGRPTLLELTEGNPLTAQGGLIESVSAEVPTFEPKDLLVYPAGAVTLHLPISIPSIDEAIEAQVVLTYMACSATTCKAPVVGKVVTVQVPNPQTIQP